MDLKKYDELRNKIQTKDFEGKNKNLDKWLFRLSFLGNIGSIFFAYFLVLPSLEKAISTNFIDGNMGKFLAILITIIILISFETIKRLVVKNFCFDYVINKFKLLKGSIVSWLIFSILIIGLSVYFSLNGAKNFASTSFKKNEIARFDIENKIDSVRNVYINKKSVYVEHNKQLRESAINLRKKIEEKSNQDNWLALRTMSELKNSVTENDKLIEKNLLIIEKYDNEEKEIIEKIEQQYNLIESQNKDDDQKNIFLFITISGFIEILIIIGIFFREYYEYTLYKNNKDKLEKIYEKRDRYKLMLEYIYQNGKIGARHKLIGSKTLVEILESNSTIPNPKQFVDIFLKEMDNMGIFVVEGKRRYTNVGYDEAMNRIDNFDDSLKILKFLK